MNQIVFHVPGTPVGKGRPRAAKRGKHITLYTPEKTVSYEGKVALAASQAMVGRQLLDGPVVVCLDIHMPVPASWSRKARAEALADIAPPAKKPDADNVLKAICDAINGVVWIDDVQVVDCVIRKRYRETPGVQVEIKPYAPLVPVMSQQFSLESLACQQQHGGLR